MERRAEGEELSTWNVDYEFEATKAQADAAFAEAEIMHADPTALVSNLKDAFAKEELAFDKESVVVLKPTKTRVEGGGPIQTFASGQAKLDDESDTDTVMVNVLYLFGVGLILVSFIGFGVWKARVRADRARSPEGPYKTSQPEVDMDRSHQEADDFDHA